MSTITRTANNLRVLSIAQVVVRLSGLVLLTFLTRYLGAEDFGRYSLCLTFSGMFAVFTRLGMREILVRDLAEDYSRTHKYLSTALLVQAALSILSVVLTVGFARILGYEGNVLVGIFVGALIVVMSTYEFVFGAVFDSRERMGIKAGILVLRQIIWLGLAFLAIQEGSSYLMFLLILLLVTSTSTVASALVTWRQISKFGASVDRGVLRRLVLGGLPLAGAAILVDIYLRVDILMVERISGPAQAGLYSAGFRLIQALGMISGTYFTVIFPLFSRLQREDPQKLRSAFRRGLKGFTIVFAPVAAGVSALAAPAMHILGGSSFVPGADALGVAIWVVALQGLTVSMGRMLVALDQRKVILYVSVASVGLNIGLNFLLIPRYAILGAAIASVLTELMVTVLNAFALRRSFDAFSAIFSLRRVYLAAVLMGILVHQFQDWPLPASIGLGVVAYVVALALLRAVNSEDRELLMALLRR